MLEVRGQEQNTDLSLLKRDLEAVKVAKTKKLEDAARKSEAFLRDMIILERVRSSRS